MNIKCFFGFHKYVTVKKWDCTANRFDSDSKTVVKAKAYIEECQCCKDRQAFMTTGSDTVPIDMNILPED